MEHGLHAALASWTAAATEAAEMARMQTWSMGQRGRKHGAQGAGPSMLRTHRPRGALRWGSVGPKSVTVGTPRAAARCATPVSLLTRQPSRARSLGSIFARSRPTV